MSTIRDVIKLKSGYANFVELKGAYEEAQENADRIAMYRPTQAHRQAFERICRGLYQPNDKKFYLLSGSYGTGKSHLCLMTANFLSRSSGDPEISDFYESYTKLDPDEGKKLRNIRKDGQYLIAICDYHSGRQFEDVVLKAVFEVCNSRGLDIAINTEFDEADRQLQKWLEGGSKGNFRDFYADFKKALDHSTPDITIEQLRTGLVDYDSNMLKIFRSAYKEMMGGIEFQYQSGNLIAILKSLLKSKEFKDRFKGLAIFFDEFGFTLEKMAYSKDILQGFMESICQKESNVIFVGCIHKDFKTYADRYSQEDAAVMSARITEVGLRNEGIEEIISAIVETDKQSSIWKKEIEPKTGVFDQLVPLCKSLDLFPWIDDVHRIRQRVLEDIYGVHPIALACLLRLSSEIGSDARSAFTFFSGDVEGKTDSYADFIKKAKITVDGGKLNLYTVDRLFGFFEEELSVKNTDLRDRQRQFVNGYYASMDALRKVTKDDLFKLEHDDRVKILQTILIYQLCQIPTSVENIQFGLYCLSLGEKKQIEKFLKDLDKNGVIFCRQQSKTYELAASTGEDPYDLIERYVEHKELHPEDTVSAFLEEARGGQDLTFQAAKQYNLPFEEDKRFRRRFVRAKDLNKMLWDELREDQEESQGTQNSHEGTLVYALCEDEFQVNQAREAVKTIIDQNVAVSVPDISQPFIDTLLRVKACRHYLPPNHAEKISAQTESRLRDILENSEDGYLTTLKHILSSILEGDGACWYWNGGKVLVDKPKQNHAPADILCQELFKQRCSIKHPDLNYSHDNKWHYGKNKALKQAVSILLEAEKVFIDNANPDSHGEKRYLEKVLVKGAGALKKIRSAGPITYFECDRHPENIHSDFPVLKTLCDRLAQLKQGEIFSVGSFLNEVRQPPFGAGGTAMILSLAHVVRAYGECLVTFKDSTKMIEQTIGSYEDVIGIVGDPLTKLVFEVREITTSQNKLVDLIAKTVGAPSLKHGESRSIQATFEALEQWWNELPRVAKVIDLYPKESRQQLAALKDLFNELSRSSNKFHFILEQIPSIYTTGADSNALTDPVVESVAKLFEQDIKQLNDGEQEAKRRVAEAICKVFGGTGDIVDCKKVIYKWHESLNPNQRDPRRSENEDVRYFLHRLDDSTPFETNFMKQLPEKYDFGPVVDWVTLHFEDYASKIRLAKAEIDNARMVVPPPPVDGSTYEVRKGEKKTIKLPEGVASLVFTTDGSDPRQSDSTQKVSEDLNLTTLLKNLPKVTVNMRTVDVEGNRSDMVTIQVLSYERKYEVQVKTDFVGEEEAVVKWPSDIQGLEAVLISLMNQSKRRGLLSEEKAHAARQAITDALNS